MIRSAIFRRRSLSGANLASAANAGAFGSLTFVRTLFMQRELGFSPLEAGLAFLPLTLSAAAGGLLASRIVQRVGARATAAVSMAVTAACFAALAATAGRDSYAAALLPGLTISGFFFATAFVPLTATSVEGVREGERGLASGLLQTSTHLGGALVLALVAGLLGAGYGTAYLAAGGIAVVGAICAARLLALDSPLPSRG